MSHTEADIKAFNSDQAIKAQQAAINEWLALNPQVGQLNGGSYYYISNGEAIEVSPLQKLN